MRLTEKARSRIIELMNPEGSNYKDINWIKLIERDERDVGDERRIVVEVGYWITYLNCKPKYEKVTTSFSYKELKNDLSIN